VHVRSQEKYQSSPALTFGPSPLTLSQKGEGATPKTKGKAESDAIAPFTFAFQNFVSSSEAGLEQLSSRQLPTWFAVVATAAAIAILVATATAVTTTTATTVTTATAVATTAVATRSAISSGPSFIDGQITAAKFLAIKLFDCRRGFFGSCHLDKAEASRATGHAVLNDSC
jgi:hypothetical protein